MRSISGLLGALAISLMAFGGAQATQLPYPTISGLIDSQLPTNQAGTISAPALRGVLHNMLDSVPVTDAIYPAAQTGSTYTYQTLDQASSYTFSAATPAITLQKPVALPTTPTQIGRGWWAIVTAGPSSNITITPTGSTINGLASLGIAAGASKIISTDGINYYSIALSGSVNGTVTTGAAGQAAVYTGATNVVSGAAPGSLGYTQSTNGTGVQRTFQSKFDDWISIKDYGAVGNGTADDTTAINTWLAAVSSQHKCGYAPGGTYKFTAQLTTITTGYWCVHGDGSAVTNFKYAGTSTTANIFPISGTSPSPIYGIELSGFSLQSATTMTSGYALIFEFVGFSNLNDVVIGSYPNGTNTLFNGVAFAGSNFNKYNNGQVWSTNDGISAWSGVELNIDNMILIDNGRAGIHVGGGFGGLYTGYVSESGNPSLGQYGLLIDTSIINAPNTQIFVSDRSVFDSNDVAGVLINDPDAIGTEKLITFNGWASSTVSGNNGFVVTAWASGSIEFGGGSQIIDNTGNGIVIGDASTTVDLSLATLIKGNGAAGLLCTVVNNNIQIGARFIGNGGTIGSNCHGNQASLTAF